MNLIIARLGQLRPRTNIPLPLMSFCFGKPTVDGVRNLLTSNLIDMQYQGVIVPCVSQGVYHHCTGVQFGGETPLIAMNVIDMHIKESIRTLFEVALRLLAKNSEYPLTAEYQAQLFETIDDDDESKKIWFKYQGRKFVTHLHEQEQYWMFIIAFIEED